MVAMACIVRLHQRLIQCIVLIDFHRYYLSYLICSARESRDLRTLWRWRRCRHFGRAAKRCFVSQPTLSAQIRKLERYLGVSLVERQPSASRSHPRAVVVERARRVLQESDAIVELAQSARDPLAGQLRVVLIPTVGPYLPRVARALQRDLPKLKLLLYEYQTARSSALTRRVSSTWCACAAGGTDGRPGVDGAL